jgi:hypothetical protein
MNIFSIFFEFVLSSHIGNILYNYVVRVSAKRNVEGFWGEAQGL